MSIEEREKVATIMRLMSTAAECSWRRQERPVHLAMTEALRIAVSLGLKFGETDHG